SSHQAENPAWHELHARILQALDREVEAAAALERCLALDPGRVPAATLLATLYHERLRRPSRAEATLERLVECSSDRAGALVARARFRVKHQQEKEALTDLNQAIQLNPDHLLARVSRAELADRLGDPIAIDHWQHALRLAPDRPELVLALAKSLRENGRDASAADVLRAGLTRLTDHPALLLALAEICLDQGEFPEAERLRQRLPREAKAASLYLRGASERRQRRWQAALNSLDEAIRLRTLPRELAARAWIEMSLVHAALDLPEERLLAARQAIVRDDTLAARLEHAEAALAIGRIEEALQSLRAAAAGPRQPLRLSRLLARAITENNARLAPWQQDWAEMQPHLEAMRRDPSTQVEAVLLQARERELRGEPDQALTLLRDLIYNHPRVSAAWMALAAHEARHGMDEELRNTLRWGDVALRTDRVWLDARLRAARTAAERDRLLGFVRELPIEDRDWLEPRLVDLYLRQRLLPLAERINQDLLTRHPQDERYRLWAIEMRLLQGDEAGAQQRIAQLRREEGDEGVAWRCAEAQRLRRRDPDQARQLAEAAHQRQPTYTRPLRLLAQLADDRGETNQALNYLLQTLQRGDWSPDIVQRAVQLLLASQRHADADALLERAQARGVFDPSWNQSAALIALQAGRPERARDLAKAALPGKCSYRDFVWLARVLVQANELLEAEHHLREATRLAPDALDPWLELLRLYRVMRRLDRAELALREMTKQLAPHRVTLAEARGYEVLGRLDEAEACLRQRLEERPRDLETLIRLADLQMRLGWWSQAEASLQQLLDPDGPAQPEDWPRLRRQLALLLTRPDRPVLLVEPALGLLDRNRREDAPGHADDPTLHLVRGSNPEQRSAALEALLAKPPREAWQRVRWGQLLDAANQWDRARAVYLELAAEDPDTPLYPALLVDGLLRHNAANEAILWFDRLRRLDPSSPTTQALEKRIRMH
ncbi:MAG: tetratricopeptide repeat protein, partial [Gemmataceae bacterium]